MAPLSEFGVGQTRFIQLVGGERTFRRRLMELGLVPGTSVEVVGVAPLGDPLKLVVRGCALSIRRSEAAQVLTIAAEAAPVARGIQAPTTAKPRVA
jgi:ferrous iron transport protein A